MGVGDVVGCCTCSMIELVGMTTADDGSGVVNLDGGPGVVFVGG